MEKLRRRTRTLFTLDSLESRALLTLAVPAQISSLSHATVSNDAYVTKLFDTILYRSPGDTELADITSRLDAGKLTRSHLALGMLNSTENLTNIVNASYRDALSTSPTQSQLNAGVRFLGSKSGNLNALNASIYGSQAFRTANGITNNTEFVNTVASYAGVKLTASQETSLVGQLNSGKQSSSKVAKSIITSHDALAVQIDNLYNNYHGTSPTAAQLNSAFTIIAKGKRWGLTLALINSPSFAA